MANEIAVKHTRVTAAKLSTVPVEDGQIIELSDQAGWYYDSGSTRYQLGSGSGHIIENPAGTDMTQRANMQFVDSHLTDDSTNDRTKIETIKSVTSAQFAQATEDGLYNITDGSASAILAEDVGYDNTSSGLTATDVQDAIDELATEKADSSTTLAGYGITDAYTKAETDAEIDAEITNIGTFSASGESFALTPTSEGNVLAHTLYGMSTQDGTPAPSSPVDIVSSKADFRCVGKNLLAPVWTEKNTVENGITYTFNSDGTIIFNTDENGATANTNCNLKHTTSTDNIYPAGSYILSGCPSGGGLESKFRTWARAYKPYDLNSPLTENMYDAGEGIQFTINEPFQLCINVTALQGKVCTNLLWKPMLTLASIINSDYDHFEPYHSTTVDTDLTLRAIEVTSSDGYNLVRDGKYYIADTVDWSEDDGYVLTRRVGHDSIITATYYEDKGSNLAQFNVVLSKFSKYSDKGFSNRFIPNNTTPRTDGKFYLTTNTVNPQFIGFVEDASITSVATATTWLSNHETYVDYALATPTTSPLTAQQAEALLSLKTYDTATSITCTADVSPTMAIEYAKERVPALALSGHNLSRINALKIADLNTALIELGGN